MSREIGVDDIKKASKKYSEGGREVTFNDIVMAALSKTLRVYFNQKGYKDTKDL